MRVMLCANTAWNLVNFREGLIRALIGQGFEVVAAAPADAENAARLQEMGCRFEPLVMASTGRSPLHDLALTFRLWRMFRRVRPDVVLGYTIKPNIYGSLAARLAGIPVINNISGLGTAFLTPGLLNRIVRILYRIALLHGGPVFFQNADDRNLFVALGLVPRDRTALLPGSGVDLGHFEAHPPRPMETAGGVRFLMIARLLRDKGLVEYVDAARMIKAKWPQARFALLGFLGVDNPSAIAPETLDGWIAEGVIDYAGSASDVRPHIAASDCVVLPSYREGTPRTLLEAAAMARPLIATDVPGCRDVVDHGVNGFLCEARDVQSLFQQFDRFMALSSDERAAMGDQSRAKVERQFDERFVIKLCLDAIAHVTGRAEAIDEPLAHSEI